MWIHLSQEENKLPATSRPRQLEAKARDVCSRGVIEVEDSRRGTHQPDGNVTVASGGGGDAGVIADEPSTSSAAEEFGPSRGDHEHTSLSRRVTAVWNDLRASKSLADVDIQFQTTEYRDEMTMDSLIEGEDSTSRYRHYLRSYIL